MTSPPEHLIEAAIKAATVVTKSYGGAQNQAQQFGGLGPISTHEVITTTQYLDRARAIAVVEAILKAQGEH